MITINRRPLVWHVSSNRWYSAVTAYCFSCIESLSEQGYDNYLTQIADSKAHTAAVHRKFNLMPIKNFGLASFLSLRKIYNELLPEVIFVYGGAESFVLAILGCSKRSKIIRVRGQDRDQYFEISKFRKFYSSDGMIAPSKIIYAQILKYSQNVRCIPYASRFQNYTGLEYFHHSDRPVLLIFGRLDPIKGHREFIEYFGNVLKSWPENHPKLLLRIVGEEANLSKSDLLLSAQQADLILGIDIEIITERITDVFAMLSDVTCGVIPSIGSEVICRVGVEFLLAGTPLIVNNVGSLSELIDLEEGVILSGLEVDDMIRFIIKSFGEDRDQRILRSINAREKYSLDRMGRSLVEFIDSI